jgi:hypothetical protein
MYMLAYAGYSCGCGFSIARCDWDFVFLGFGGCDRFGAVIWIASLICRAEMWIEYRICESWEKGADVSGVREIRG